MTAPRSFTGRRRQRKTRLSVRMADKAARSIITVGGIGTIIAVSTVFVFLLWVIWPLFLPARVDGHRQLSTSGPPPARIGVDEQQLIGWSLEPDGSLRSFRLDRPTAGVPALAGSPAPPAEAGTPTDRTEELDRHSLATGDVQLTASAFSPGTDSVAFGYSDGTVRLGRICFLTRFLERSQLPAELQAQADRSSFEPATLDRGVVERTREGQFRHQRLAVDLDEPIDLDPAASSPVIKLDCVVPPSGPVLCVLTDDGKQRIVAVRKRRNMLTGKETSTTTGGELPAAAGANGPPDYLFLTGLGDNVCLIWKSGRLLRYETRNPARSRLVEELKLVDQEGTTVSAVSPLLGRNTLLTGDSTGRVRAWFRVNPDEKDQTTPGGAKPAGDGGAKPVAGSSSGDRLICAHDFAPSGAAVTALAASSRTRIFAVGLADGRVRLVHATSEKELALVQAAAGSPVAALAIAPRDNGLIAMSAGGGVGDSSIELSRWNIDVRHPEITLATLFNPVWYESYSRPRHLFQSSSGSQSFEPKYGLRPLIFGTLKATVYSMLFGAPLALMAAIFTSEFLHPRVRSKLKPAIELMASLPSVVLGFLAALFFAPLVARAVPEVLVSFVTLPLAFLAGAHVWQLLPQNLSLRLARWRFLFIIATLPVGIVAAWRLGPLVERWLFASDIRLWLNGQVGSGTGGWMFVLLPLCGVGTFFLGRELNTWLRPRTYHWTRAQCAALEIVKFLAGTTLVLAGAWLLALLLNTLGWDPRGSYLGTYDQRNTLIVGVVMGFAIIPLIYTIAEDALSTVPEHLRSASLGAGATQWQTATRIVVPIAMSGLFTALMIGLGRAVGETMIVLMATGNTPVMEWNVFNGLRSLSATIAAELPEAPVGSTHYRTLFFAAFCLFMLTFVVNTAAELVRLRFRRRAHEL